METCFSGSHLGVVIVTYNSQQTIEDCLESLYHSDQQLSTVVVIDNASSDDTLNVVRVWSTGKASLLDLASPDLPVPVRTGPGTLVLVHCDVNSGFATGVNMGLKLLLSMPEIRLFWILNPDCRVRPDSASGYLERARQVGEFALMGGRMLHLDGKDTIESDGGKLNLWTGVCASLNLGRPSHGTPYPDEADLDYIPGASLVASRTFLESAGLMHEEYFLFFEELDWALRRGALPLVYAPGAVVEHHGGTAIGSPVLGRTQGSSFANYFNYRNRIRFMRRFYPWRVPVAYSYALLKVAYLFASCHFDEALGAFCGLHQLPPPRNVRLRLSKAAARIAFGE